MKKTISVLMLILIAALISVSCKSAPPEALTEPVNEPITRVEAARQRAIDFESPTYFPSDWEALEERLENAKEMPLTTEAEVQQAVKIYNELAESYDELFKKTIPLYAQALEDEILAKRDELIATGFTRYFRQYLIDADNITLRALDQYEAEDYYAARDTAALALEEYEILLVGARVFLARQEVMDRDFAKYDQENFSKADDVATNAIAEFDAGNRDAAIEKAEEALLRYNLVLSNGWTAYAAEKRQISTEERRQALAVRANIASREFFREAETFFNQAESSFSSENFHEAGLQFMEAEARYILARKDTDEKRLLAEAAIRTAEERIEESNEAAIEAERILEGGVR